MIGTEHQRAPDRIGGFRLPPCFGERAVQRQFGVESASAGRRGDGQNQARGVTGGRGRLTIFRQDQRQQRQSAIRRRPGFHRCRHPLPTAHGIGLERGPLERIGTAGIPQPTTNGFETLRLGQGDRVGPTIGQPAPFDTGDARFQHRQAPIERGRGGGGRAAHAHLAPRQRRDVGGRDRDARADRPA